MTRTNSRLSLFALLLMTAGLTGCGWAQWPPKPIAINRPTSGATAVRNDNVSRSDNVVVARGDTVYGLSKRYNVPTRTIIEANRLAPPYYLYVGQRLSVPGAPGSSTPAPMPAPSAVPVTQVASVPLTSEAPVRGASVAVTPLPAPAAPSIVAAPPPYEAAPSPAPKPQNLTPAQQAGLEPIWNPIMEPVKDAPMKEVVVKPAILEPAPADPATPVQAAQPAAPSRVLEPPLPAETAKPVAMLPAPAVRSGGFLWPISNGKTLAGFGSQGNGLQNDGINIEAPRGTPIHAAENGVVAYAGNEIRGFGNMILIKHNDGWVTAYAHADQLLVKRGDTIKKGDIIGKVGSTGSVDKPQLHFELRQGKKPVDPTRYIKDGSA